MRIDAAPDDDLVALVRATTVESVVVVVATGRSALSLAQAEAAIGPLAIQLAPDRRINAIVAGSGAAAADVDAAVAFLDSAAATTGQVLTVS